MDLDATWREVKPLDEQSLHNAAATDADAAERAGEQRTAAAGKPRTTTQRSEL